MPHTHARTHSHILNGKPNIKAKQFCTLTNNVGSGRQIKVCDRWSSIAYCMRSFVFEIISKARTVYMPSLCGSTQTQANISNEDCKNMHARKTSVGKSAFRMSRKILNLCKNKAQRTTNICTTECNELCEIFLLNWPLAQLCICYFRVYFAEWNEILITALETVSF